MPSHRDPGNPHDCHVALLGWLTERNYDHNASSVEKRITWKYVFTKVFDMATVEQHTDTMRQAFETAKARGHLSTHDLIVSDETMVCIWVSPEGKAWHAGAIVREAMPWRERAQPWIAIALSCIIIFLIVCNRYAPPAP